MGLFGNRRARQSEASANRDRLSKLIQQQTKLSDEHESCALKIEEFRRAVVFIADQKAMLAAWKEIRVAVERSQELAKQIEAIRGEMLAMQQG